MNERGLKLGQRVFVPNELGGVFGYIGGIGAMVEAEQGGYGYWLAHDPEYRSPIGLVHADSVLPADEIPFVFECATCGAWCFLAECDGARQTFNLKPVADGPWRITRQPDAPSWEFPVAVPAAGAAGDRYAQHPCLAVEGHR